MSHPRADVFSSLCPSRNVLDLLAQKWTLLLIDELTEGARRTAELRRRLDGISEKVLIQTLRKLEQSGLVARHDFGEVPPRVEYRLTPLGISLSPLVRAFDRWMEEHVVDVLQAREAFETQKSRPRTGEQRNESKKVLQLPLRRSR
jgi:DNA-binding HxlR family transcriptional regulator